MIGTVVGACLSALTWEGLWWCVRRHRRGIIYKQALAHARAIGRPLVVIGAPDAEVTSGYGCGDITVDLVGSKSCPTVIPADITKPLMFHDDSVVVAVFCVLEYVDDYGAALSELYRISGGHLFVVHVEPHTFTAHMYPGAKRTVPPMAPNPVLK